MYSILASQKKKRQTPSPIFAPLSIGWSQLHFSGRTEVAASTDFRSVRKGVGTQVVRPAALRNSQVHRCSPGKNRATHGISGHLVMANWTNKLCFSLDHVFRFWDAEKHRWKGLVLLVSYMQHFFSDSTSLLLVLSQLSQDVAQMETIMFQTVFKFLSYHHFRLNDSVDFSELPHERSRGFDWQGKEDKKKQVQSKKIVWAMGFL